MLNFLRVDTRKTPDLDGDPSVHSSDHIEEGIIRLASHRVHCSDAIAGDAGGVP